MVEAGTLIVSPVSVRCNLFPIHCDRSARLIYNCNLNIGVADQIDLLTRRERCNSNRIALFNFNTLCAVAIEVGILAASAACYSRNIVFGVLRYIICEFTAGDELLVFLRNERGINRTQITAKYTTSYGN